VETLSQLVKKYPGTRDARSRQLIPILCLVWSYNDYMRRGKVDKAMCDYENLRTAVDIARHQQAITDQDEHEIYRRLETPPAGPVGSFQSQEDADESGPDS
jgi:hypothetical protein